MTRKWKPGDVGVYDYWGYRGIFVSPRTTHDRETCWHNESGHADPGDQERRPLAVIDPENREQVERLLESLYSMSFAAHACGAFTCLQAALREFADPTPPIEEPLGLGAVVEDEVGLRWVRTHDAFWESEDGSLPWSALPPVVRVLSEGVATDA